MEVKRYKLRAAGNYAAFCATEGWPDASTAAWVSGRAAVGPGDYNPGGATPFTKPKVPSATFGNSRVQRSLFAGAKDVPGPGAYSAGSSENADPASLAAGARSVRGWTSAQCSAAAPSARATRSARDPPSLALAARARTRRGAATSIPSTARSLLPNSQFRQPQAKQRLILQKAQTQMRIDQHNSLEEELRQLEEDERLVHAGTGGTQVKSLAALKELKAPIVRWPGGC